MKNFPTIVLFLLVVAAFFLMWASVSENQKLESEIDRLEDRNDILIEENINLKDYLEKNT